MTTRGRVLAECTVILIHYYYTLYSTCVVIFEKEGQAAFVGKEE